MTTKLSETLDSIGYTNELTESWAQALLSELSIQGESGLSRSGIKNMPLVAFVFMEQGRQELSSNRYNPNEAARQYFSSAYSALKAVFEYCYQSSDDIVPSERFKIIDDCPYIGDLKGLGLSNDVSFAFLLCICGVLSDRLAEVRHDLRGFELEVDKSNWLTNVATSALISQILLIRKNGGWEDIDRAFLIISDLTSQQKTPRWSIFEELKNPSGFLKCLEY